MYDAHAKVLHYLMCILVADVCENRFLGPVRPRFSASRHTAGVLGTSRSGHQISRHQVFHVLVAQAYQETVKCTWPGCARVVREDSYTWNEDETHRREVKAVCARCDRRSRARI
jgi:hypothetical protein